MQPTWENQVGIGRSAAGVIKAAEREWRAEEDIIEETS